MSLSWGRSWGRSWLRSWGIDTHDGGAGDYYYKWWLKQHKTNVPPTLEQVVEAVKRTPKKALEAVAEAKEKFDYVNDKTPNPELIEYLAIAIQAQITAKLIEKQRILETQIEEEFIEIMLLT